MFKNSILIQFIAFLVGIVLLAFLAHIFLLENAGYPSYDNKIVLSYLVNAMLAATIFGALYWFRVKLKNYIGFLFMIGSFVKFIFFFVLFYPAYKADGDINSLEFAAFFVPYAFCLILETIFTAKVLQKLD